MADYEPEHPQCVEYIIIDEAPYQGLRFPEGIRKKMVDCVFPAQKLSHLGPLLLGELVCNKRGCRKYYYVTAVDLIRSLEKMGRHGDAVEISNWFKTKQYYGVVFSGDCCRLLN